MTGCVYSPLLPLYHFSTEGRSTNPQPLKQKGQHKRFQASMLSTPRKNSSISVGCSSVWETRDMQLCGIQSPQKAKADNPLSSLPEGLQVNLKASLSPSGQTHALLSKGLVSHFIPWLTQSSLFQPACKYFSSG